MVRRDCEPDCIVLVEPFVCLHEVENPLLEVVNHADLHYMEKVWLREDPHDTGNMLKHVESSLNMALWEFSIGFLGFAIAESSI